MANKKKSKKKSSKSKKSVGKKATRAKKQAPPKRPKKRTLSKKAAKNTAALNKSLRKKKDLKNAAGKTARSANNKTRIRNQGRSSSAPSPESSGPSLDEQSGDLQGLSNVETADSESVDELLEEGNSFEAGVVAGVEDADEHDEREVHTREVPEDDVPGEYLDEE
jgi:hypothetical protein